MIFGLGAALGWGLADFGGAVAGRRIGSRAVAIVASARPGGIGRIGGNAGTWAAVATGAADLFGVSMFSYGAQAGFVSIVLVTSAIFPRASWASTKKLSSRLTKCSKEKRRSSAS